jgi:hypothetical protein
MIASEGAGRAILIRHGSKALLKYHQPDPIHCPGDGTLLRTAVLRTARTCNLLTLVGCGRCSRLVAQEAGSVGQHAVENDIARMLGPSAANIGVAVAQSLVAGYRPGEVVNDRRCRCTMENAACTTARVSIDVTSFLPAPGDGFVSPKKARNWLKCAKNSSR